MIGAANFVIDFQAILWQNIDSLSAGVSLGYSKSRLANSVFSTQDTNIFNQTSSLERQSVLAGVYLRQSIYSHKRFRFWAFSGLEVQFIGKERRLSQVSRITPSSNINITGSTIEPISYRYSIIINPSISYRVFGDLNIGLNYSLGLYHLRSSGTVRASEVTTEDQMQINFSSNDTEYSNRVTGITQGLQLFLSYQL
jgi:hypothetical protein